MLTLSGDLLVGAGKLAELPDARGFPAAALSRGGVLFVVGGFDAATMNDSALVETLDLKTMKWSRCSSDERAAKSV
eukprot:COSAG01_NODE_3181_length_6453_cov_7.178155_5_plen_76_part_00